MASSRKPATHRPSTQKLIKRLHRRHLKLNPSSNMSLKEFIQTLKGDDAQRAATWLFNKKANFSKPPLDIGSTRKKKGGAKK